jgi:hypothetical protein
LCLLGRTTRGVLSLASNLTRLASHLLGLPGGLTRRLLYALGRLPDLIRDPAEGPASTLLAACQTANGVL